MTSAPFRLCRIFISLFRRRASRGMLGRRGRRVGGNVRGRFSKKITADSCRRRARSRTSFTLDPAPAISTTTAAAPRPGRGRRPAREGVKVHADKLFPGPRARFVVVHRLRQNVRAHDKRGRIYWSV